MRILTLKILILPTIKLDFVSSIMCTNLVIIMFETYTIYFLCFCLLWFREYYYIDLFFLCVCTRQFSHFILHNVFLFFLWCCWNNIVCIYIYIINIFKGKLQSFYFHQKKFFLPAFILYPFFYVLFSKLFEAVKVGFFTWRPIYRVLRQNSR